MKFIPKQSKIQPWPLHLLACDLIKSLFHLLCQAILPIPNNTKPEICSFGKASPWIHPIPINFQASLILSLFFFKKQTRKESSFPIFFFLWSWDRNRSRTYNFGRDPLFALCPRSHLCHLVQFCIVAAISFVPFGPKIKRALSKKYKNQGICTKNKNQGIKTIRKALTLTLQH